MQKMLHRLIGRFSKTPRKPLTRIWVARLAPRDWTDSDAALLAQFLDSPTGKLLLDRMENRIRLMIISGRSLEFLQGLHWLYEHLISHSQFTNEVEPSNYAPFEASYLEEDEMALVGNS